MRKATGSILTAATVLAMVLTMVVYGNDFNIVGYEHEESNLKGGDIRKIQFTAPETETWSWKLTAETASGWVHVPDTQYPNSSSWQFTGFWYLEGFTGNSGIWTSFKTKDSETPERNFQIQFTGRIRQDGTGPGGSQEHTFTIDSRAGEYFVVVRGRTSIKHCLLCEYVIMSPLRGAYSRFLGGQNRF